MGENKIMKKYKGVVFFDYDGTTVDEVMLAADSIIADGADEQAAVDGLIKLVESGFAE